MVTPGQRFYSDLWVSRVRAYRISQPFESSMPGSMHLPFHFALDDTLLVYVGTSRDKHWSYFAPHAGKFRAWHALLGSVIVPGDEVGLMVSSNNEMQWFVDNSNYNHMSTTWSRSVKRGDPSISEAISDSEAPSGIPLKHLDYLGVRNGEVLVRYTEVSPTVPQRVDEYAFKLDDGGAATGNVMGAAFSIRPKPDQTAEVLVSKPMEGEYGNPVVATPRP
jgi:hypothetical protein